jgi:hypothetical protein
MRDRRNIWNLYIYLCWLENAVQSSPALVILSAVIGKRKNDTSTMNIDFENIYDHIIPLEDFDLIYRFTEEKCYTLPTQHIDQLKPLDKEAAKFLWDFISITNLHEDEPFKKDFFRTIDHICVSEDNEKEIKKWLYQRGFSFDKPVFLSWDRENAIIVPWKLLIKYFDSFYYGGLDDLTVIDESLNWALIFAHWDVIYFGTNREFNPTEIFADFDIT